MVYQTLYSFRTFADAVAIRVGGVQVARGNQPFWRKLSSSINRLLEGCAACTVPVCIVYFICLHFASQAQRRHMHSRHCLWQT